MVVRYHDNSPISCVAQGYAAFCGFHLRLSQGGCSEAVPHSCRATGYKCIQTFQMRFKCLGITLHALSRIGCQLLAKPCTAFSRGEANTARGKEAGRRGEGGVAHPGPGTSQ